MERECEVFNREDSLLGPDLLSFFTLDVGVRARGGELGGSGLGWQAGLEGLSSVVARLVILVVSKASIVSRRISFGRSVSGGMERLAAVRKVEIQLLRMPWVTAERVYLRSSRVETMKP